MDGSKTKQAIKTKGARVVRDPDDVIRDQAGGFANFLREYAVVGLAIGFILGQEANAVVRQFVTSFIQPWLQMLFGANLGTRALTLHSGDTPIKVQWGAFLYIFIEFLFVAIIIYLVFRMLRLDKLKEQKKEIAKEEGEKK